VSGGAGPWQGIAPGERPFHDAAWHYAEYRYRPAEAFLRLLAAHLGWSSSDRILDLGAGPAHLSLPLARFVDEVVAMDPEEAMIEEGRRRATDAAVENVSFIVGGSDDLARLVDELGDVAGVVISQAFHWMADQDTVLRALDPLVDQERGAVALVGSPTSTTQPLCRRSRRRSARTTRSPTCWRVSVVAERRSRQTCELRSPALALRRSPSASSTAR
jgi:SAM-dependent methyltransferase